MPKPKKSVEEELGQTTMPVVPSIKDAIPNKEVTEEVKKPKTEMVEISRTDLEKLIGTVQKQTKDIDLLYRAADKSRIAKELNKEGSNLIKQCNIRTWADTGELVVGWKLTKDRCEVVQGRWIEEQIVDMVLESGEVLTIPLIEFYRKTLKKVPADIVARTQEINDKNEIDILFKLQFENGKTLSLNSAFVN